MPPDTGRPTIGDVAPVFALASVQGSTVELAAYRGHRNVVVWFSRGFTCPFCLGYMDGIREGYQDLVGVETEVIQVAPNMLASARSFFGELAGALPARVRPRQAALRGLRSRRSWCAGGDAHRRGELLLCGVRRARAAPG